uniref:Aminoglycoside phosphotransferase domain-containing protein n=1 Tax=Kwoniella bestiolae CBS 10118 TaxID=1296100 RepID=A0A1B9GDI6_9TREE|nr:hypothetical protein I302_00575 [Kwoniella bestiolae CBS 10118]OCF29084.1 hypothetical protein I302_00575 [Kwoniella bestiolae CBS 10118]
MAAFDNCHIPNCIFQALTWPPVCPNCHARYCYQHRNHPLHGCWVERQKGVWRGSTLKASNEPELLDPDLIKEEIESLRPGSKVFKIDKRPNSMESIEAHNGQFNLQIKIDLEDGQSWMMRTRRKAGIRPYPDEPLRMNVQSEVATCQVLYHGGVNVPDSIPRPKDSKLIPKLIYCYQRFIEGSPWKDFAPSRPIPTNQPISGPTKKHIMNIAKWFISLERVEFNLIGSPTFSSTSTSDSILIVGPLIERQPAMTIPPYFAGPFSSVKERYLSTINSRLNACRARTWVEPPRDVEMYLALLELGELVENDEEMGEEGRPFFIRHADDHWDHTRTQGEGEVTGVIDWEWAYTTNKAEAFSSPTYFLPDEFYEGKKDVLSPSEHALLEAYNLLGRKDLAGLVRNARKYQRLTYFLRCMFINVDELNALKRAFLQIPDEEEEGWPRTEEEWVEGMLIKWREDGGLKWLVDHPWEELVMPE